MGETYFLFTQIEFDLLILKNTTPEVKARARVVTTVITKRGSYSKQKENLSVLF